MHFTGTGLSGSYVVDVDPAEDARGLFARTFCQREFTDQGISFQIAQCSTSFNLTRGTLRGMHFQRDPKPEAKLVRCTRGLIYDVLLDLRPFSATYKQWRAFELSEDNRRALYIPKGIAHGFQSLADSSEVFYQMDEFYDPALSSGVRWNDPVFSITWPILPPILSDKDASRPDFKP